MSNSSGISKERLAYLVALHREQQKPSPVNPGKTIGQDIEDSLKEDTDETGNQEDLGQLTQVPSQTQQPAEESFQDKLKRLRSKLLAPIEPIKSSIPAVTQDSSGKSLGNTEKGTGTLEREKLESEVGNILPTGTDSGSQPPGEILGGNEAGNKSDEKGNEGINGESNSGNSDNLESVSIKRDAESPEGKELGCGSGDSGTIESHESEQAISRTIERDGISNESTVGLGIPLVGTTTDKYGNEITYNSKQAEFIRTASSGESCVLIGAAGTGKTTCQKGVVGALNQSGFLGKLEANGHKHLISDTPGIVICAYTRRAVANIRRNMPIEFQSNCITIHKLLEYEPVYFTVIDEETGKEINKMAFEPARNSLNPIPPSIKTIVFEEGSMLGIDLHKQVSDASPHNPQQIFLGDIQQLPPVFGPAILGFKLLELPVVELTEVYRQALESPIIRLAHRVLSGIPIPAKEYPDWCFPEKLTVKPWKKKIKELDALNTVALMFCGNKHVQDDPKKQATGLEEAGYYDPEEDIILIPFNKSFGTDELNKKIAHYLARKRGSETFQVIAGFNKHYFSPGDRVLFDKEDAVIESIKPNPIYSGAKAMEPSITLDYWGFDPVVHTTGRAELSDDAMDFLLNQVASTSSEDRVNSASHQIILRMSDYDKTVTLDKAGDINNLSLGYCLTVHKSQGSEWRKVFFIMHQSHATMLQRELLYTGITRAREELFIVCEPETFTNGIKSQRVKGDTLAEKAEYFKGRKSEFNERIG